MAIAEALEVSARKDRLVDRTTAYARDVVAGRIVTGELVTKACQRHLDDLEHGHERGLRFDVDEAERSIDFYPAALRHWKGELAGQPVVLGAWQCFIVGSGFGWKRADGTRRFRLVYVEVAKKNGKTLMGAGVGMRLAFFDGEPGAEVYSLATKRDQAKFVWKDGLAAWKASPALQRRIRVVESRSNMHDPVSGSKFEPLGKGSERSDQGINAHGGIIDELHVLKGRDEWDNLETSMGARRQPMRFAITTPGVKGKGIWATIRADVAAVVERRVHDDSVFGYIATLDDGDDPFDEAVWPKANPNLDVSVKSESLREAAATAKRQPGAMSNFLRLRMSTATPQSGYGLDLDAWDDNPSLPDPPGVIADFRLPHLPEAGRTGAAGLDLASTRDLTAYVVLLEAPDDFVDVLAFFWCPEEGIGLRSERDRVPYDTWAAAGLLKATPGNVTDYDVIRADVNEIAATFGIVEVAYDPWNATQLATQLEQDGAAVVPTPQGYAHLSEPTRELERLVYAGKLRGADHPILRWMAGNVVFEEGPNGSVRPSKAKSHERIDGIAALVMAIKRFTMAAEPVVWTSA